VNVAFDECDPAMVVLLGVDCKRHHVGLEGRAFNRLEAARADASGACVATAPVCGALPLDVEVPSTVPTAALRASLAAALCARGLPATLSEDAGRYLCNAAYLHALRRCQPGAREAPEMTDGSRSRPCLFVHVPQVCAMRSQPIPLWLWATLAVLLVGDVSIFGDNSIVQIAAGHSRQICQILGARPLRLQQQRSTPQIPATTEIMHARA